MNVEPQSILIERKRTSICGLTRKGSDRARRMDELRLRRSALGDDKRLELRACVGARRIRETRVKRREAHAKETRCRYGRVFLFREK